MSKDNFDLRAFLAENKLTENSRGTRGRYHFDGSQNNSGRARVLTEMKMPASPQGEKLTDMDDNFDMNECGDFENDLLEAGYTDDDLEFGDSDDDLTLQNLLAKDRGAAKARKAAARDIDTDMGGDMPDPADDEPAVPEDEPAEDLPDDTDSTDSAASTGLSSQLRYNPDLVEFEMSDSELDTYLSNFRRPNVAVNFLNRALKAAQTEVNDMNTADSNDGPIKTSHVYLVLGADGYYHTSAFRDSCKEEDDSGKPRRIPVKMCIAKINGDPNYKSWED